MNTKRTVISLILLASLHGQAFEGNRIAISPARFASLNNQHIQFLVKNGLIEMREDKAILNMAKFDDLLKAYENQGRKQDALIIRSRFVPYGCT